MSPKFSPKLKLRLPLATAQSNPPSPPRNSFTITDYYRTTREEYYSPISRVESLSPNSPYGDFPQVSQTPLTHIHESSEHDVSDKGDEDGAGQERVGRRSAGFWHILNVVFRKLCRQKNGSVKSKAGQRL